MAIQRDNTLNSAQALAALELLAEHLTPAQKALLQKLASNLDAASNKLTFAQAEARLFTGDEHKKASVSLSKLLTAFDTAATAAGLSFKIGRTASKKIPADQRVLYFTGQAPRGRAVTETEALVAAVEMEDQRASPIAPMILLLTSPNKNETQAVFDCFVGKDKTPRLTTGKQRVYEELGMHGKYRVIHTTCAQGSTGLGASQATISEALHEWPAIIAVFAVGVAFGVNGGEHPYDPDKSPQRFGDVLVSEHLQLYDLVKHAKGGELVPRGPRVPADPTWLAQLRSVNNSLMRRLADWPRVKTGLLLSGDKLVNDADYRNAIVSKFGSEALGGEMEGTGLYVAAQTAKRDWLVIKGISDWADGNKNLQDEEGRQRLAARNAALVTLAMINPLVDPLSLSGLLATEATTQQSAEPEAQQISGKQGLAPTGDLERIGERHTEVFGRQGHLDKNHAASADVAANVMAFDYIVRWRDTENSPPLFALLGDYGMGKTVLCQRLYRAALTAWDKGELRLEPYYFDLRELTDLRKGVPTLEKILEECLARKWLNDREHPRPTVERVLNDARNGAFVIFDGLDEALVHYNEADGQTFTRTLLGLLPQRRVAQQQSSSCKTRLLISCRTEYFRSLREAQTHFTGQDRSDKGAAYFDALTLLPWTEVQIDAYLRKAAVGSDPAKLMELFRSVHNLEELTQRPYTLAMTVDFIPDIERWRNEGRKVFGVTLYRRMMQSWLERDSGKHQLKPADKLQLAADLAAHFWSSGQRTLPAQQIERWVVDWLHADDYRRKRYASVDLDKIEEDLRNSTFLNREDGAAPEDSRFRFAHSSMLEFFLAQYLFGAIENNRPEQWQMEQPSAETLDFLGQLLAEAERPALLLTLQKWAQVYRAKAAELLLAYALRALEKSWPVPSLQNADLRGAQLQRWKIGTERDGGGLLDLRGACFAAARLQETQWCGVNLKGSDFTDAFAPAALFYRCNLEGCKFIGTTLDRLVARRCALQDSHWESSKARNVRLLQCHGKAAVMQVPAWLEPLPFGASATVALALGRAEGICHAQYSPDGATLVSAGDDGTLRLWDARSGDCLRVFKGHEGRVYSAQFAPDGATLVSASDDDTLRLWDARSGDCLRVFTGHEGRVNSAQFAPDGATLVSAGDDRTLRLWDARSGDCLRVFTGHKDWVNSAQFAPDGATLVSASDDDTLRLWDARSGDCLRVFMGHKSWVSAAQFAPDGSTFVSASNDGTLRLWDARSGDCLRAFEGHKGRVCSAQFAPDGATLVSAGDDGTLRLWDARSGDCLRVFKGHEGRVYSAQFAPDGATLVSASGDSMLRLWDARSGDCLRVFKRHEGYVSSAQFAPDGATFVSASGDSTLRLWDARSGDCLRVFTGHEDWAYSAQFAPDGATLVSASGDSMLRLWDARSGDCLRVFKGHKGRVYSAQFAPDGATLVSASNDGSLRLWDARSGDCLRVFKRHEGYVNSARFAPDGATLVSANGDGTLRLWDARSGDCLRVFKGHKSWVNSAQFAPDGATLVSASNDGTLRLWDARSGDCLRVLTGHEDWVNSAQFAPDGATLVSASNDGTLRLWDARSGDCLRVFTGHEDWVNSVHFAPDGATLVSATVDGTLRLWDCRTGQCLKIWMPAPKGWLVYEPLSASVQKVGGAAWRWFDWRLEHPDGRVELLPLENFGELSWSQTEPECI